MGKERKEEASDAYIVLTATGHALHWTMYLLNDGAFSQRLHFSTNYIFLKKKKNLNLQPE